MSRRQTRKKTAQSDSWYSAVTEALQQDRVFTRRELQTFLRAHRAARIIPARTCLEELLEILEASGDLQHCEIPSIAVRGRKTTEGPYDAFKRYVSAAASAFDVALSLRPRSYLSHGSALDIHRLTAEDDPTLIVYANQEQSPKPAPRGLLNQSSIDQAFRNHARTSQYVFKYRRSRIVLLNGKNTDRLGVVDMLDAEGVMHPTTCLERTLIDVTVRPVYAGGVRSVAEAYRKARDRVSVELLLSILDQLKYVYPYHQAVGFYMERTGYSSEAIQLLRRKRSTYDFYLEHRTAKPAYDREWRIYYPTALQ